jgi:hypothetical protein
MGLDAKVFCNCYELHKVRTQPPHPELVYVDEDGSLCCRDRIHVNEFDQWRHDACEHEWGYALHHYIGNVALVAFLRDKLRRASNAFPIILTKVIYNGIHGGDYIALDDLANLQNEVAALSRVHGENQEDKAILRRFETQIGELIMCALEMKKPITF